MIKTIFKYGLSSVVVSITASCTEAGRFSATPGTKRREIPPIQIRVAEKNQTKQRPPVRSPKTPPNPPLRRTGTENNKYNGGKISYFAFPQVIDSN